MDPSNHNVILVGSQRVFRSVDNGISYAPISGDLTTNPAAQVVYGTITTLDISPLSSSTYFAGTDDGRVWRSTDAGSAWIDISAGLPIRWVTRVVADPASASTVYVTLSGFTLDEGESHVYRSTNLGATWTAIGAELPNSPANDLVVAPWDPLTLFAATDVGVYATRNLGATWYPLGQGLPLQAINDLNLHAPTRTLVAATHGRSQWRLDLNQMPLAVGCAAGSTGDLTGRTAPESDLGHDPRDAGSASGNCGRNRDLRCDGPARGATPPRPPRRRAPHLFVGWTRRAGPACSRWCLLHSSLLALRKLRPSIRQARLRRGQFRPRMARSGCCIISDRVKSRRNEGRSVFCL